MNQDFQTFLKEFSSVTSHYYGSRLDRIILYGSFARGEEGIDSDVDLMIVLKDEKINPSQEILNFGKEVYPIGWKYGHFISILPTSMHKFSQSRLPVYQNARTEGIKL